MSIANCGYVLCLNLSWLIEKFWPVKGWTQEDLDKLKKNESGI